MATILSGILTLTRLEQPNNERAPIEVTVSGILMLVRLEQPRNEESPIEVTPVGISTLTRRSQPKKASLAMEVTGIPWHWLGITRAPTASTLQSTTIASPLETVIMRSSVEAQFAVTIPRQKNEIQVVIFCFKLNDIPFFGVIPRHTWGHKNLSQPLRENSPPKSGDQADT